jgi:TolA-binding protein
MRCKTAVWAGALLLALISSTVCAQAQVVPPEQAAQMVLDSASRAYNKGEFPLAVQRFTEYLQKYANQPGKSLAFFGLGMSLLEAPQVDAKAVIEALRQAAADNNLPDRGRALYYLAATIRDTGLGQLAQADAQQNPDEARKLRTAAQPLLTESAGMFPAAADALLAQAGRAPATAASATQPAAAQSAEVVLAARAKCDLCDAMLRLGQFDQAKALANEVLAHPRLSKTPSCELATYQIGYAQFGLRDYREAGRTLSKLAPFEQDFGLHARFLLARAHQLADERPEALGQFQAVLDGYEKRKAQAVETLKQQNLPAGRRAALTALAQGPAGDYVIRAQFHLAQLTAEMGKYAEAAQAFGAFAQKYANNPLVPEAQLRLAWCQIQQRSFNEAIGLLGNLAKNPDLADQATWWLAKAKVQAADPANAQAYAAALAEAIGLLRRAAENAAGKAATDPAAKDRRGEILMELADTQQLARQYKEAAETYQLVIQDPANATRIEEASQRQTVALHLAGMYQQSDDACRRFEASFPRSTLLPAVWFRAAENAFFVAKAAADNPNLPDRVNQLRRLYGEAVGRYEQVIRQSPDFQYVNLARYALATIHYRQQRYQEAVSSLSAVPDADRTGELAAVNYLMGDCLLRTLPADVDDAVGVARMVAQAQQASKLLEAFVGAAGTGPKAPETPDALLKLGWCYQRVASVMRDVTERNTQLQAARAAYERVLSEFGATPAAPAAIMHRAQCLAIAGDVNTAITELMRFRGDPLRNDPIAPLALARLGAMLRAANRAAEAVNFLAEFRNQKEAELLKDASRRGLAATLQYEHALALLAAGKNAEAFVLFDSLAKNFAGLPEAVNAVWRAGQCRRQEFDAQINQARLNALKTDLKPEQLAAADKAYQDALAGLRQAIGLLYAAAQEFGRKDPGSSAHQQLLYETAWCCRSLAEDEIDAARRQIQEAAIQKLRQKLPQGAPAPAVPGVAISQLPVQPSETTARLLYERLLAAAPNSELAARARLELADMLASRPDHADDVASAAKCLAEALTKGPDLAQTEQISLRLAACLLAGGDADGALARLATVGAKPVNPNTPARAAYLAGEALLLKKQPDKAVEQLKAFRDNGQYHNLPNLSDRAMLRLGQALAAGGQHEPARQAFETLIQRYPASPWVPYAFYEMGRSLQAQKRHDDAVKAYAEVIQRTVAEIAAMAQFQIGACRAEQLRYADAAGQFLLVPMTYDYPERSAAALYEAARASEAMKQPAEAARLYREVLRDHPRTSWAKLSADRLVAIGQ